MTLDNGFWGWFYKLLYPLEWLMTYILDMFHKVFVFFGMPDGPGFAWVLSIIFLVVLVRLCILPLFIKQMKSMRRMQAIQPQLQKIQKKYKGKNDPASREAMSRETMKLYQENDANPMGSCLPALIQSPIFMTMFYVLSSVRYIANGSKKGFGAFDQATAQSLQDTPVFNIHLSSMFTEVDAGGKITIGIFIALMCFTMFYSQFHNIRRNTPKAAQSGQTYRTQMMMALIFPFMYIFSGIAFPFAVLIYWLTNNTWTLCQTFWQVRNMPTPGSPAAEDKEKRDYKREQARRKREGLPTIEEEALAKAKAEATEHKNKPQRYQPTRKNRAKKGSGSKKK